MKQLLIFGFALCSIQSFSQVNLDSITSWTYSLRNFGIVEPHSLFINGDTIIDNTKWFKLYGDGTCAFPNPDSLPLVREENDKWLVYNVNREEETTLYDFSLVAGESYTIELFGPNFTFDIFIDSTSTRLINGKEFKVQHINVIDFGFEIIEGIGCSSYLFPQGNICDPHTGPIRCYANINESVNFYPERDCDAIYLQSNTNNLGEKSDVQVYPNPALIKENIICTSKEKITGIEVINQNGFIVHSQINNANKLALNFKDSGLYFLRIKSNGGSIIKKLIISNR